MVVCAIIVLMWRPEGVPDVPSRTPDPHISFRLRKKIVYLLVTSLFDTATTTTTTAKTTRAKEKNLGTTMNMRAIICDGREDDSHKKREKDGCLYLPRRSLLLSLTNLDALLSGLEWKWISKVVMYDMSERVSERAKKFSNVDNHQKRPTPEHAEARQQPLQWSGCRKRCQRHTGNRLQSTSAPNETRDGIGREKIPQSSVTAVSGAGIGREKRWISSASAKVERPLPGLEFERATPNEARTLIGRESILTSSVVPTSASLIGAALCTPATILAAAA